MLAKKMFAGMLFSLLGVMMPLLAQEVVVYNNPDNSNCEYDEEEGAYRCYDPSVSVYYYYYPDDGSYYYPSYPGVVGGYWWTSGRWWNENEHRERWGERRRSTTSGTQRFSPSGTGTQHFTPSTGTGGRTMTPQTSPRGVESRGGHHSSGGRRR